MIGRTVGHYRILERLGGGGMGVVYKAEDTTLDRVVALKFLPNELTRDDIARKRFLVEARAAAKLDHPNICTVFEVGETDDGETFIAMAYYDGESLAARLERGPLPVEDAVRIATDVARGLGAAHEAGIIHRDIKPANIMLTDKGEVKVVDFGIAKLGGATVTRTSSSPGTLAYMAPEQIQGEPVTPATDLWSLGVVLQEMLTGSRPFRGDFAQAVAYAILHEEPKAIGDVAGPAAIDTVLAKALAKDPKDRYRSAEEMISELGTITEMRAIQPAEADKPRNVGQIAILSSLIIVLITVIGYGIANSRHTPTALPSVSTADRPLTRVAVAVFDNRTGDHSLDPVGQMVADWTSEGLARIGAVEVVGEAAALQLGRTGETGAKPGPDPVRQLAELTGAELVVSGSYYVSGDELQIQTRITDGASGAAAFAIEPAVGSVGEPLEAVQMVRQRVVDAISGRYLGEGVDVTREEVSPPRYEAYKEYLEGLSLHGPAWDSATAVAHYKRALELDPDFVKPRFGIIMAHLDRSEWADMEREIDLVAAKQEQLTPIHVQRLRYYRAILDGREGDAVRAMRNVVRLAPTDVWENYLLANEANVANLPYEALQVLDKPLDWSRLTDRGAPYGLFYFTLMAGSHHMLGQHLEELDAIRRGRQIYGDDLTTLSTEARALAALGRTQEIDTLISHAATVGSENFVLSRAALELRAHGNRAKALELWNRLEINLERLEGDAAKRSRFYLAWSLYRAERWDETEKVFEEFHGEKPDSFRALGYLGDLAARRGDREKAQKILDELAGLKTPYLRGDNTFYCARIAAQLGEREEAVRLLRKSIAEGLDNYPGGFVGFSSYYFAVHEDIAFEPLYGYPPFEELMKPKG